MRVGAQLRARARRGGKRVGAEAAAQRDTRQRATDGDADPGFVIGCDGCDGYDDREDQQAGVESLRQQRRQERGLVGGRGEEDGQRLHVAGGAAEGDRDFEGRQEAAARGDYAHLDEREVEAGARGRRRQRGDDAVYLAVSAHQRSIATQGELEHILVGALRAGGRSGWAGGGQCVGQRAWCGRGTPGT